jgi:hypothetical protein
MAIGKLVLLLRWPSKLEHVIPEISQAVLTSAVVAEPVLTR